MLRKMLAVDDSAMMHHMYRLIFDRYKCEISDAMNGQEALDLLASENGIQLIVLDLNMPIMNGVQFLEKASILGITRRIPVIIVSTEGKEADTLLGLKLGAKGYLKKPFNPGDLHNLIEKLIPDPAPNPAYCLYPAVEVHARVHS